jgi:hypothetical protein
MADPVTKMAVGTWRIPALTPEQVDALPSGPIVNVESPINDEDRAKGMRGRCKITPIMKASRVHWHADDEPIAQRDSQGHLWFIGEWVNGGYYKEHTFL